MRSKRSRQQMCLNQHKSFNSDTVRSKRGWISNVRATVLRFNSDTVRSKRLKMKTDILLYHRFNSDTVRSKLFCYAAVQISSLVSIPTRCDQNVLILCFSPCHSAVSIPTRCDQNIVHSDEQIILPRFQFRHGAIKTNAKACQMASLQ